MGKSNLLTAGRNSNTSKFTDLIALGNIFPGCDAQNACPLKKNIPSKMKMYAC